MAGIYLNSGTLSKCPSKVFEAVQRYQREYEENPTTALFETWPRLWQKQVELAAYFNARPQDMFLRANVTMALNSFLMGIDLPSDGEIIATDLEYGAIVNICRLRAEKSGLEFRTITIPSKPRSPEELLTAIVSSCKSDTRMLLVSHVMTGNGMAVPLKSLAKETRKRGIILAVDGAHGPGALPIDFEDLGDVDFYGGNLHKWFLGPKGVGFGWVPERVQPLVKDVFGGWTTFDTPIPFKDFGGGSRFALRMLNSSCHDFAPFFAISELVAFWRENQNKIQKTRADLRALLEAQVAESLGWECLTPTHVELAGPMRAFDIPGDWQNKGQNLMHELSREYGLQVASTFFKGKWAMRFSPDICNSEAEVREAIKILKKTRT